jgi:GNAT superfamily N-acetyltransferase
VGIQIVPLPQRPELESELWSAELMAAWPEFMRQDHTATLYYGPGHFERFREFALVVFDDERPDRVLGRAFSVPFVLGAGLPDRDELPDHGWDCVIRWAHDDALRGRTPNAVSALEILLHPTISGRGLSSVVLEAMRANTARRGFADLYAPVRPSAKHLEPEAPIAEYAARTRDDGLPVDPWLRVHVRAGGRIVKVAPCSMTISGTLAEWRAWTGAAFDADGPTAVPGALSPVHASIAQDHAVYVEPNVWVHHRAGL